MIAPIEEVIGYDEIAYAPYIARLIKRIGHSEEFTWLNATGTIWVPRNGVNLGLHVVRHIPQELHPPDPLQRDSQLDYYRRLDAWLRDNYPDVNLRDHW